MAGPEKIGPVRSEKVLTTADVQLEKAFHEFNKARGLLGLKPVNRKTFEILVYSKEKPLGRAREVLEKFAIKVKPSLSSRGKKPDTIPESWKKTLPPQPGDTIKDRSGHEKKI